MGELTPATYVERRTFNCSAQGGRPGGIWFSFSDAVWNLLHFLFPLSHFMWCSCQPYRPRPFYLSEFRQINGSEHELQAHSWKCNALPNNHESGRLALSRKLYVAIDVCCSETCSLQPKSQTIFRTKKSIQCAAGRYVFFSLNKMLLTTVPWLFHLLSWRQLAMKNRAKYFPTLSTFIHVAAGKRWKARKTNKLFHFYYTSCNDELYLRMRTLSVALRFTFFPSSLFTGGNCVDNLPDTIKRDFLQIYFFRSQLAPGCSISASKKI